MLSSVTTLELILMEPKCVSDQIDLTCSHKLKLVPRTQITGWS
jgi:hypothetical protein